MSLIKPNKYGLPRTIPEPIKRVIRKNSGFGCVICGLGIVEYEHVDPEYHEAKAHDPACMTLLCPNCHSKVTSRIWSKQKVKDAMKNPKCLTQGYSNDFFDLGNTMPTITFAGSKITNTNIPLMIKGVPIFKIEPPDDGPNFRLTAALTDSKGNRTLTIENNEWIASTNNWDVDVTGPTITIREGKRDITLQLTANPPNEIIVTRINMLIKGLLVSGNHERFSIINNETGNTMQTFEKCISSNSKFGFIF